MTMRHPVGLPSAIRELDRTLVFGVLNTTPDSFSDGGRWHEPDAAIARGRTLIAEGADIVDVGGESTRPGAQRIDVVEELRRVLPVVRALAADGIPVSIDTMRAEVAAQAVAAGACIVNDVSGGLADAEMLPWLAQVSVPYIAMHWRGPSSHMAHMALYSDVVHDVVTELHERVIAAIEAQIDPGRLVVDPGLGFAKTPAHNWEVLRRVDELVAMGYPVLIGASRKRFLGELLADAQEPRDMAGRDVATHVISGMMGSRGVWAVRVHEPRGSRDAIATAHAMKEA